MKQSRYVWSIAMAALAVIALRTWPATDSPDNNQRPPVEEPFPKIDADGTVHIPGLAVPLSAHMSDEARKSFIKIFTERVEAAQRVAPINAANTPRPTSQFASRCPGQESATEYLDDWHRAFIERAKAVYPVNVEEQVIGGVRTDVITPKEGIAPRNRHRVLLNVHGGGYGCATSGGLSGQVEAIPIAAVGKLKVIAIDYRTSPKHKFPAATEDVAAVYREVLKTYEAENIGFYGCSTGATLSAGAVAWLQKEKLPRPGAIGLFCDGATKDDHVDGDGWFVNMPLTGGKVLAPHESYQALYPGDYMVGTDYNDPLVAPVVSQKVLAQFPPTLVISGTRDIGLSEAVYTHSQLVKARVDADLHIWEGMWHNFFFDVDLPESKEAFDVVARVFDKHLGRKS